MLVLTNADLPEMLNGVTLKGKDEITGESVES